MASHLYIVAAPPICMLQAYKAWCKSQARRYSLLHKHPWQPTFRWYLLERHHSIKIVWESVYVCIMQLHWDVEPIPTIITDRLLPRLVQLGVITAVSDVHQAVLNMYHKVLTMSFS